MARIIRVFIDLDERWDDTNFLTLAVGEQIRTAHSKDKISMQVGHTIDNACIELAVQVAEDVLRSAVGRTLGIHEELPF